MVSIDAHRIDFELLSLFRGHIERGFALLDPDGVETFKPEIEAVISLLLWWTCIYKDRPTPGMSMLNLKYYGNTESCPPRKSQRAMLGLCTVLAPWLFERLRRIGLSQDWPSEASDSSRGRMWRLLERSESVWKFLYLANLLAFLRGRRHSPSVADTLSGIQIRPKLLFAGTDEIGSSENVAASIPFRNINFQFMNRELMWDSFTSFALFAAPALDRNAFASATAAAASGASTRLQRGVRAGSAAAATWGREWRTQLIGSAADHGEGADNVEPAVVEVNHSIRESGHGTHNEGSFGDGGKSESREEEKTVDGRRVGNTSELINIEEVGCCVACGTGPANMPYVTSCGHTFCYYCVKSACLAEKAYVCPQCGSCFASACSWMQHLASNPGAVQNS